MRTDIIKYTLLGAASGLLSWLPTLYPFIMDDPFHPGVLSQLIFFLPPVFFALLLFWTLNSDHIPLRLSRGLSLFVLILGATVSWYLSLVASTIGVDFDLTQTGEVMRTMQTGLLPSFTGVLIMALALKGLIRVEHLNIKLVFFVVNAGLLGILVYAVLGDALSASLGKLIGSVSGAGWHDALSMAKYLLFFLFWNLAFYLCLDLIVINRQQPGEDYADAAGMNRSADN